MCKEYQDEGGYNSYSESDGSESFDDSSNNDSDTDDGSKDGYKDNGSNSDDDSDDSDPLEDSADEDNSGDTESSETDTDSDETSSTNFLKKKKKIRRKKRKSNKIKEHKIHQSIILIDSTSTAFCPHQPKTTPLNSKCIPKRKDKKALSKKSCPVPPHVLSQQPSNARPFIENNQLTFIIQKQTSFLAQEKLIEEQSNSITFSDKERIHPSLSSISPLNLVNTISSLNTLRCDDSPKPVLPLTKATDDFSLVDLQASMNDVIPHTYNSMSLQSLRSIKTFPSLNHNNFPESLENDSSIPLEQEKIDFEFEIEIEDNEIQTFDKSFIPPPPSQFRPSRANPPEIALETRIKRPLSSFAAPPPKKPLLSTSVSVAQPKAIRKTACAPPPSLIPAAEPPRLVDTYPSSHSYSQLLVSSLVSHSLDPSSSQLVREPCQTELLHHSCNPTEANPTCHLQNQPDETPTLFKFMKGVTPSDSYRKNDTSSSLNQYQSTITQCFDRQTRNTFVLMNSEAEIEYISIGSSFENLISQHQEQEKQLKQPEQQNTMPQTLILNNPETSLSATHTQYISFNNTQVPSSLVPNQVSNINEDSSKTAKSTYAAVNSSSNSFTKDRATLKTEKNSSSDVNIINNDFSDNAILKAEFPKKSNSFPLTSFGSLRNERSNVTTSILYNQLNYHQNVFIGDDDIDDDDACVDKDSVEMVFEDIRRRSFPGRYS